MASSCDTTMVLCWYLIQQMLTISTILIDIDPHKLQASSNKKTSHDNDKTSLMPTQQKVSTCQTRSIQVPFLWIYPDPGVCIYALNLLNHSFICIVLVFLWWLNNVWKLISFADWKRLKEGERVALGHFHERVGESPRREKNFGTSGSKLSRFVSEIWPFEVGIGVRADFTM